jgi:hypothetical protein
MRSLSGLRKSSSSRQSIFWRLKSGDGNHSVGFRPAVGSGITAGQKCCKEDLKVMASRVEKDVLLDDVGEVKKCVGEKRLSFSFVSLPKQPGIEERI